MLKMPRLEAWRGNVRRQVCGRAALQLGAAVTYSSRIPLAPQRDTQGSENPSRAVLSLICMLAQLLCLRRFGVHVFFSSSSSSSSHLLEQPFPGSPRNVWWALMVSRRALHLLPVLLASLQHQGCLLQREFAFSSINKQSHPEFERKGCIFVPLKKTINNEAPVVAAGCKFTE